MSTNEIYTKLSAKNWSLLLSYASGDAGFNFYWVVSDSFLLFFYADVMRLPSWSLTFVLLAGRGLDLIVGVLIGAWADRTQTRWGSYRPFLLWAALPLAAAYVASFSAPSVWPQAMHGLAQNGFLICFAVVTSCCFTLLYSSANIPYTAMLAVLTRSQEERVRFSSARFAAAASVVMIVQFCTLPLVQHLGHGDVARGWQSTTLVYSVAASLLLILCFTGTREIVSVTKSTITSMASIFELLRVRTIWLLFAATSVLLAALSCRGAASVFYITVNTGHPEWTSLFLTTNSLAAFAACLLVPLMPRNLVSTHSLALTCAAFGAITSAAFCFVSTQSVGELVLSQICFGFSTGALLPALFSLYADLPETCIEFREKNVSGIIAAGSLISLKLGSIAGASLVSIALAVLGYRAGGQQSNFVHLGMTALISILPCLLFVICFLLLRAAPLRVGQS